MENKGSKDDQVDHLKRLLREKDDQITKLQKAIDDYQEIIVSIHQSLPARIFQKYDTTLGKILPIKSKKILQRRSIVNNPLDVKPIRNQSFVGKDIICFPMIDWDYRYQRVQHLLTKFAQKGHRVFYLTVNLRPQNDPYIIESISKNIYRLNFNSPKFFDIFKDKFNKDLSNALIKSFDYAINDLKIDAICYVMFPTWIPIVKQLKEKHNFGILYDWADNIQGFSNINRARIAEEKELINNCDLVIASSSILYDNASKMAKRVFLLPNAADFEHFNKRTPEKFLTGYGRPIVGYFGAIAEWFDIELIKFLAKERPNVTFIFIGDTYGSNLSKLLKFKNVHFLGERPYSELPKYLHEFDVCIIPFRKNSLTDSSNPIKIYEYFSAGKPVVTTNIMDILSINHLCYVANSKQDFLSKLDNALEEKNENLPKQRIMYAQNNTWDHRFVKLYTKLAEISSLNLSFHN